MGVGYQSIYVVHFIMLAPNYEYANYTTPITTTAIGIDGSVFTTTTYKTSTTHVGGESNGTHHEVEDWPCNQGRCNSGYREYKGFLQVLVHVGKVMEELSSMAMVTKWLHYMEDLDVGSILRRKVFILHFLESS